MFDIQIDGQLTESLYEGIDHLHNFVVNPDLKSGYNYAMLFDLGDDVYNIVERVKMPCWGAVREYGTGTRPDDYWPEDLQEDRHKFPEEGKPVAISFRFHAINFLVEKDVEDWNRFIVEFAFHETESPWASILNGVEVVFDKDVATGVLFTDTKIDPTAMVSLMRLCGSTYAMDSIRKWARWVDEGVHPKVAFLSMKSSFVRIDPDLYFSGTPMDRCDGLTFYERASYNRPRVEYVFGGDGRTGVSVVTNKLDQIQIVYESWLSSREKDNGICGLLAG